MRFVKPIDEDLLHEVFKKFKKVITIEDNVLPGGFGSAVLEFMADHNYSAEVVRLGIPDQIVEHGEQKELWSICRYDAKAVVEEVKKLAKSFTTNVLVG
jgi:1-deoxy-D-xylulose-5-phosphate synthase